MHNSKSGAWTPRVRLIALMIATMMAAGCGSGGGSATADSAGNPQSGPSPTPGPTPTPIPDPGVNPGPVPGPTPGVNTPPTISGTAGAQITVGSAYALVPTAHDADGDTLAFSVENRPDWAIFNTATGQLTGTPGAQHVGAYANIMISVSDGASSVSMPAFSITVALASGANDPIAPDAVALTWDVPTHTVDGATLFDLSGYRLHFGSSANALTGSIEIPSSGNNRYVVAGLASGTYYFAVRAVTQTGAESALSNVISRTIS